jgi:zinc and cadmium transporter
MTGALIASFAIASISLIGVFFYGERGRLLGSHRFIIPFAIGVFLGAVFFELVPETLDASPTYGGLMIVAGFILFYLLSHLLHTYHHHEGDACYDKVEGSGTLLLVGDTVHNFSDGIVLATAFLIHPSVGIATAVGLALHEVPQEIVEFGVLLRAGYRKSRALLLNGISALSIVVGVVATYAFTAVASEYLFVLTGFAAGNLLYIAASDLLPELQEEHHDHFITSFVLTLCGIGGAALLFLGHNG